MTEPTASQKCVAIYQNENWWGRVLALAARNATFAANEAAPDADQRMAAVKAMAFDRSKLLLVSMAVLMDPTVNAAVQGQNNGGAEVTDEQILGPIETNLALWATGLLA